MSAPTPGAYAPTNGYLSFSDKLLLLLLLESNERPAAASGFSSSASTWKEHQHRLRRVRGERAQQLVAHKPLAHHLVGRRDGQVLEQRQRQSEAREVRPESLAAIAAVDVQILRLPFIVQSPAFQRWM